MQKLLSKLSAAQSGEICSGFRLIKKEYVAAKSAELYTLRHEKTGAELLYFDRADENKTFTICFKTLPEDDTGVFHILEHSVLNGSRRFPVKEPFVTLLQGSMQTYLNALTFSDKTMYPVSSRNEQDLFNLMSVYLDAVFCPLIHERPEIFMQEGWHYEFDGESGEPYYNGVVFSEMKGAFSDVDTLIGNEMHRLLYPNTSYGYVSGGDPKYITSLSYEKFTAAHKRFYHPSNARIFLDGHMNIDAVLEYIDGEYLSKYEYRAPDFDFAMQTPVTAEKTISYEVREGEEALAHMASAKILCTHKDVEKLYAAEILADYLTGSNEAPLKRAFLESGLAQDVSIDVNDGMYQPNIAVVVRNTAPENFAAIKAFIPETVRGLLAEGLNREALSASLERSAFTNREITEPSGLNLAIRALDGWLYGDDPLTHIDNAWIFDSLREKLDTDYFTDLLVEMLGSAEDKCYVYVLPSAEKGQEDAREEAERLAAATADWDDARFARARAEFEKMQQWQQSMDSEEDLAALPHLNLEDVPKDVVPAKTELTHVDGVEVLRLDSDTNGIVYLNLYFDVSDFDADELRLLNVLTTFFGELRTEHYSAGRLQTKIKATLGGLAARVELISKRGELRECRPYLLVSASMLEENVPAALELLEELFINGRYDETGRISETVLQSDYFIKQSLVVNGHAYAVTKSLSAFSAEGAMKELLEGESFVRWFSDFAANFEANSGEYAAHFAALAAKAFASNRLFAGFGGKMDAQTLGGLIRALPANEKGAAAEYPAYDGEDCAIEIASDVGYSALGHNLYALGGSFSGEYAVLASLVSYGYLWNMIRVQGGAYGTGMNVRSNGDVFCYSYRDPNVENSLAVYGGIPDFLAEFLSQGMPMDDIIIGTVNTTEPLLDPAGVCELECIRYLKGTTAADISRIRREILGTTAEKLLKLAEPLRAYAENGKFCAVGSKNAVAFLNK